MKSKRLLLMLLMAVFAPLAMIGQDHTLTVYDGTVTNNHVPMYVFYFDDFTRSQYVIPAAQIDAMTTGTITSVKYYTSYNTAYTTVSEVDIYLAEVPSTSISDFLDKSNATIVYSGTVDFVLVDGKCEATITFTTPYTYNGGNLLIGCDNTTDAGYKNISFYGQTVNGASVSGSSGTSLSDVSVAQQNFIPKTTFTYTGGNSNYCEAPSNLEITDVTHDGATVSWTSEVGNYNFEYKLASATSWTQVNQSTNSYNLTGLTPLTAYDVRVQAVCEAGVSESVWIESSFTTTAVAEEVGDAWADNFEGTSCGWELVNGTCANVWVWGTAANNGGTHGLYISNDNGTTNAYTVNSAAMVYATKLLNFTEGKFEFTYDWIANGESTYDYLRVALVPASVTLTAGTNVPTGFGTTTLPTDWIALDGGGKLNLVTAWQNKSEAINVTAGNYYLVMAWRDDTSSGSNPPAAVDNVSITKVACEYDVTDLAVSNITTTGATLSWEGGEATQWQVAYGTASNFEGTTEETVDNNVYELTSLQAATTYYVRVRAFCGGHDFGSWSDPLQFNTACEATPALGYEENFDNITVPSIYTPSAQTLPVCWNAINTSTYSSYMYYPTIYYYSSTNYANSTPNCLRFYSSYSSYSDYDPQNQYAILPPMENLAGKQITLQARGYNASSTFKIGLMTDPNDASTFTEIATQGGLTTAYQEFSFVIPADATANYVAIMIEAANSSRTTNGVYIDDISIDLPPSCPKPTDLAMTANSLTAHGATITWTENGEATQWIIDLATDAEFSEVTFIPVEGQPTYTFSDLEPETTYYVRVHANCGDDDTSESSNVINFTTPIACPAPTGLAVSEITGHTATLNWTGDSDSYNVIYRAKATADGLFEDFATTPSWQMYTGLLDEVLAGTTELSASTSYWAFGNYNNVFDRHTRINIYGTGVKNWLVTPSVEVAEGYTFSFDLALTVYTSGSSASPTPGNQADDKFVVLITNDNGHNWTILRQWDNAGSQYVYDEISNTGTTISFDLSSYVGQNVAIAFYGESTETGGDNNMHIDNVLIGIPIPAGDWITVPVETAPYTLTGLNPETKYEVKVASSCPNEPSHETAVVSFTTDVACPVPTGLAVTNVSPNSAELSWTSGADAWEVEVTVAGEVVATELANTNPFTLTGLLPETAYSVRVRANCGDEGYSEWSGAVTFTTLEACPLPENLTVSDITYNSATVAWTGFNDNYVVSYRTAASEDAPFKQNFEHELGGWTFTSMNAANDINADGTNHAGIHTNAAHSGSYGFRFSSYTQKTSDETFDQYLVSPELTVTGNLKFYFKKYNTSTETLYFGYSTTTNDLDAFTWTEDLAPTQEWQEYTQELASDVKYIAFHYFGNFTYYVYVDDITIGAYDVAAGEWETVEATESPVILTGLTPETDYEVKLQGFCDGEPTEETDIVTFTTPEQTTITQTIALAAGTNWFSTYVEITLDDLKAALVEALPGTSGMSIASKTQTTTYNGSRWRGGLTTLDVAYMYKITVPAACEISLTGMAIDPAEHPITIPAGEIVWIGFPFAENMTPADAFAGFAVSGDQVSAKTQSTTYNGTRWRGGLTSLVPGQGYTYKSGASEERTLVYTSAKKSAQNGTSSLFSGKDMRQPKPTTVNLKKVAGSQAESKIFKKVSFSKK